MNNLQQKDQDRKASGAIYSADARAVRWTGAVVCLLVGLVAGLWVAPALVPAPAIGKLKEAQREQMTTAITDGGDQRQAMIEELTRTNAKLDQIIEVLGSGQVKVMVVPTENKDEEMRDGSSPKKAG